MELPEAVTDQIEAMNDAIRSRRQAADEIRMQYREPNERVALPSPTLWRPLDVENAAGGIVNTDYYPVRARLPEGVDPAAVLEHVRTNLNSLVDTSKSSFAAYPDSPGNRDNEARWDSANPTGSFVTIDIFANDGTVSVIDSDADHWTFATVKSPADGPHPVSGNRQFGCTDNGDGTATFYTRGVDRLTDRIGASVNAVSDWFDGRGSGVAFNQADALWRSFQGGLTDHVREIGERAQVESPVIVRPDWNDVSAVLTGRESVRAYMPREDK